LWSGFKRGEWRVANGEWREGHRFALLRYSLFPTRHSRALRISHARIDFEAELPHTPTGKLVKRHLRDKYWSRTRVRV
jgi:acyl-CoA synthetase (AMP-forming)/AMP-acid ligase II